MVGVIYLSLKLGHYLYKIDQYIQQLEEYDRMAKQMRADDRQNLWQE